MARRLLLAALLLAMTAPIEARSGDVEDCYDGASLVKIEPAKAAAACRRLAEQGDAHVQALMWFNLAAAQGEALAAKNRDNLAAKMTPAQIERAEALIAAWRPTMGQLRREAGAGGGGTGRLRRVSVAAAPWETSACA